MDGPCTVRWQPPEIADMVSLQVRYHRTHAPAVVRCGGAVVSTRGDDSMEFGLSLWAEDGQGVKTTTATMLLRSFQ